MVSKEVDYKYIVNEMVTVAEKRMVTTYDCVPVEKTFKKMCMEMVTVQEKRKVIEYVTDHEGSRIQIHRNGLHAS